MAIKAQEKTQSDLFDQIQTVDKKIRKKTRFLLPDIRNNATFSYETIIFYMIGFVMACIITFSLGVEKGRYDEKKKYLELKKGASNVSAPKLKNIKSR
ncbi:MAG: hypothetical protein WC312_06420 [Candidatus Omnitrophota bacterium]